MGIKDTDCLVTVMDKERDGNSCGILPGPRNAFANAVGMETS